MPDLIAQGEDPKNTWRKWLPEGRLVTLGRKSDKSEWVVDWDMQMSRLHATIEWRDGKLLVRRDPSSMNPIFFQGNPLDEFWLVPGEQFVIGKTTFTLDIPQATPFAEVPVEELTYSTGKLFALQRFGEAEDRKAILAKLASVIGVPLSEEEFKKHVLELLLDGIPHAHAAALVRLNPSRAGPNADIQIGAALQRDGKPASVRPSRRLLYDAIYRRRQDILQSWSGGDDCSTVSPGFDWAICCPLSDEPESGWALYVVGQSERTLASDPESAREVQKVALKFGGCVADIYGALRQERDREVHEQRPGDRIGKYTILELIGRGGTAYVYKAQQPLVKRTVAIKLLPKKHSVPTMQRLFEREMEVSGLLDHGNILRAYDAGDHEGKSYLVTEFVNGSDLYHLVRNQGPLSLPVAVDYILRM